MDEVVGIHNPRVICCMNPAAGCYNALVTDLERIIAHEIKSLSSNFNSFALFVTLEHWSNTDLQTYQSQTYQIVRPYVTYAQKER